MFADVDAYLYAAEPFLMAYNIGCYTFFDIQFEKYFTK